MNTARDLAGGTTPASVVTALGDTTKPGMRWKADVVVPAVQFRKDAAGVILYTAENATQMALQAIQILGGNGYINEFPTGRLLRDDNDYGVVALCDPRVTGKRYGRTFLEALAPMPVTHAIDEVAAFLASHESRGEVA